MTPEQQRIAIAKACGWRQAGYYWFPPEHDLWLNVIRDKNGLPDCLTDLNAMHEAEKVLSYEQQRAFVKDVRHVCIKAGVGGIFPGEQFDHLHATAAQRCEAFLKTLGLWKDTV